MVKFILVLGLLLPFATKADLFDFVSDKGKQENKLPVMIEKLKNLDIKDGPEFEDIFNQLVKAIENGVEEEKLICTGDAPSSKGSVTPNSQKQLCMRELKKQYLDAQMTIFDMKKKYLVVIHKKQLEKLSEIQSKLKDDINKNF